MKKSSYFIMIFAALAVLLCGTAYAGQWIDTENGRMFRYDDGHFGIGGRLIDPNTRYTYRMDGNGIAITGWWTPAPESGIWYYYAPKDNAYGLPEGTQLGNVSVEGYQLAADGLWVNPDRLKAAVDAETKKRLDLIGWDLKKAYDYCSTQIPYVWSGSEDPKSGTNFFAELGYINGSGNCYTMAAEFVKMAKLLGYEARQMYGAVPNHQGNLTPHSWAEIVIDGQTRVFDPDFTYETKKNGYNIGYGDTGTWRYTNITVMPD